MADVDDLGGAALDHGIAEDAGALARHLDVEPLLDDVDDLVDDETHGAAVIGEHQDRLGAVLLDGGLRIDAQQRHELIAILHEITAVGNFDAPAIDLLQPRDERKQNGLGLLRAGAEHQQRRQIFVVGILAVIERGFVGAGKRRDAAERLRDAVRIDDHDHRAVAEDRGAGKRRDVTQLRRHRLDHDLLGVKDAVDDDAEDLVADLRDDDEAVVALAVAELQDFLQMESAATACCAAAAPACP